MKKIFIVLLIVLSAIVILIPAAAMLKYRLTINNREVIKRNVVFRMVDIACLLSAEECRMYLFEPILGNKKLDVIDEETGMEEYYLIPKKDFDQCWKENPFALSKEGKTIEVVLERQKLFFGGYAPAKVIKIEKINGKPQIVK
jgi:hypothetical protein